MVWVKPIGGVAGKGSEESPKSSRKLSSQTEGVGGAVPPASLLTLSVLLRLYNSDAPPATHDKLLHVGPGQGPRPLPAPRIMSLKPAQGKLCPLGARGRRLKSRRDVLMISSRSVLAAKHCFSRRRTSASSPSRRRWCERSASSSASLQGRLVEGRAI